LKATRFICESAIFSMDELTYLLGLLYGFWAGDEDWAEELDSVPLIVNNSRSVRLTRD